MVNQGCLPNLHTYNLLLRACRECGLGDPEFANELLFPSAKWHRNQKRLAPPRPETVPALDTTPRIETAITAQSSSPSKLLPLSSVQELSADRVWRVISHSFRSAKELTPISTLAVQTTSAIIETPSDKLLYKHYILNPSYKCPPEILSLKAVATKEDRFALLGGYRGVFGLMKRHNLQPDIKSFMQVSLSVVVQVIQRSFGENSTASIGNVLVCVAVTFHHNWMLTDNF